MGLKPYSKEQSVEPPKNKCISLGMPRTLVSLVSEQPAPNLMLILDPAFTQVDRYLFVSTPRMNETQQGQHLLAAAQLPDDRVEMITVPAFDPAHIYEKLAASCPSTGEKYWVNLTGGTKMMALAVWAYFSQPPMQAECFYVSLGENSCRRIFPLHQTEVLPLQYRFSLQTYLTAYGITEQENPLPYHRDPALEALLFRDALAAHQPLPAIEQPIWWFANRLEFRLKSLQKAQPGTTTLPLDTETWIPDWLNYLGYRPAAEDLINNHELRYLSSGWFEHYVHDAIGAHLHLPADALASQVKLYRSGQDWKYSNQEFDVIFLYRNRIYIIECKTAIRRHRPETKRLFNEALYRLAALKRDFGLNVSVGLVLFTDQLRKKNHLDPAYAQRADLLNVAVIDQPLLAAGPAEWVPMLVQQK